MLEITDIIHENDLTAKELLSKCIISKINVSDFTQIVNIMTGCFKIPSITEAIIYLRQNNIDFENSVKLYDPETSDIYGLLLFGENYMQNNIPFINERKPMISVMMRGLKQIQGLAFIIDKRLRGLGIDKKMLHYPNLNNKSLYEIVWCGVDKDLNTHNYWKRLGFTPFYSDSHVKFYMRLL